MNRKEVIAAVRKKPMPQALEIGFKAEGYEYELDAVYARAAQLFGENENASAALRTHLRQILPCIAFYEALIRITGSKEKALESFDKWAFIRIEKLAAAARKIASFPGVYKKIPAMGDALLNKFFGAEAGFKSREVPDAPLFARDMTACPYVEICKKYGCPELTQFFCKSDDITYGNLHPKLVWNRTQTLGTGGECCDFRLYIKKD